MYWHMRFGHRICYAQWLDIYISKRQSMDQGKTDACIRISETRQAWVCSQSKRQTLNHNMTDTYIRGPWKQIYIWIYAGKGESIVSQPHICENLKDSMTHHRKPMCMPKSNWGNNHTCVWFNEGHISVYMYVNRIKTMSQGHTHIFEYEIRIKAMK